MSVIAISVIVKVPDTRRTQPTRKSQIAVISRNQNAKHGIAAHLLHPDRRTPRVITIHKGDVCSICRITPDDTKPTTNRAPITARQTQIRRPYLSSTIPPPKHFVSERADSIALTADF
jgi:hypothetical protein